MSVAFVTGLALLFQVTFNHSLTLMSKAPAPVVLIMLTAMMMMLVRIVATAGVVVVAAMMMIMTDLCHDRLLRLQQHQHQH